jgi:translation initiation factor 5
MISFNKLYLCSNEATVADPNYRYITNAPIYEKQKKKGTDCTYFINSKNISTYLNINHELFIKIIGLELSCQSKIDNDRDCGVFKGNYDNAQINNILCQIIKNYYLCQSCDYPEIIFDVKHKMLRHKCNACGKKNYINNQLATSKVYNAILKKLI